MYNERVGELVHPSLALIIRPPWARITPVGGAFGFRIAMERAQRAAEKVKSGGGATAAAPIVRPAQPILTRQQLMAMRLPNSQLSAGMLAVKSLAYGTALCVGGFALAAVGIGAALDVRDLNGFARKMEEIMPAARHGLEAVVGSPVRMDQLRPRRFYPRTPQCEAPPPHATPQLRGLRDSLDSVDGALKVQDKSGDAGAYMSPKEQRELDAFARLFEDGPSAGTSRAAVSAGAITGAAAGGIPAAAVSGAVAAANDQALDAPGVVGRKLK
jgi:hypothetical protein